MRYKPPADKPQERPALHQAVQDEDLDRVRTILEQDPKAVDVRDDLGHTALHHAATRSVEMVKLLLAFEANPNAQATLRETPLHMAGRVDIAQALIEAGAFRTIKDVCGMIPLSLAILEQKMDLARLVCPDEIFLRRSYRDRFHWPEVEEPFPDPPFEGINTPLPLPEEV